MTPSIVANKSLRELNTFGFEQRAEHYAEAPDEAALVDLLDTARQRNWPVFILGGGSNVVLARDMAGLVIRYIGDRVAYSKAGPDGSVRVSAQAGKNWHDLVLDTLDHELAGLENLALIPGSVGAAPVQNIGAYGVELKERLAGVRAWHRPSRQWHELSASECAFGYRDSRFKREPDTWIITAVSLELGPQHALRTDYASLAEQLMHMHIASPTPRDIANAVMTVRRSRLPDPADIGNAGSFFHNPVVSREQADGLRSRFPDLVHYPQADGTVKLAAGWLIDQLGYRGYRDGGIGVHERQALVLVHEGGATGGDLLSLVARIQASVRQRYGVELQPEPLIIADTA